MAVVPTLLDCTIRDGSYAIDFKFTEADTALIASQLDAAGIGWIEVGHGVGLGASDAGKGRAASHDLDVIARTREQVQDARIGAFFIPGIGRPQDLRDAAAAGLGFVRIGYDADEIDKVLPSLEIAREAGLEVFVNFMKSYGITPAAFARGAAMAEEAGAIGAYVVDSAGGMLPAEVTSYISAARAESAIPLGFHGHSNLHLAVANSLAAFEAGAEFIDTSVYGIGRSSGNVPTEVMAAVFSLMGVDCGVDPLAIIDLAEAYLTPLAEHLHPHDMIAVSLGLGRFHSSFLPAALEAAEAAGVNPFRLIVALGRNDVMRMTEADLETAVAALRDGGARPEIRREVARFSHPGFGPSRIRNRAGAVAELLDGLEVVAAKRRLTVVLDLVSAPALGDNDVTAEFVLEDEDMALGRVRFGSGAALAATLGEHGARIGLALLDVGTLAPGATGASPDTAGATLAAVAAALDGRVVAYRSPSLEAERLGDLALAAWAATAASGFTLDGEGDLRALEAKLAAAAPVARGPRAGDKPTTVNGNAASPDATTIHIATHSPGAITLPDGRTLTLDRDAALRDTLPRWRSALDLARGLPQPQLAH
jgi:4-hydroxy 2-oxovalerate aldolase